MAETDQTVYIMAMEHINDEEVTQQVRDELNAQGHNDVVRLLEDAIVVAGMGVPPI